MTRWAILGTGMVARKFISDLRHAKTGATAVAVASRSFENARACAADLAVAKAYETYAEAAAASDVDAVYIATPPALHEAHAMLALTAGKAVLIEKPFAQDAAAARRIAQKAQEQGLFCMEAMWTRFLPVMDVVRARLQDKALGELRSLSGSFGISSHPDADDSLFDPARGGGALLHRGIYPVSLASHLIGPISDVTVAGRVGDTGVDEDITLILRHENQVISTVSASLRAPAANDLTIGGTHGMLRLVKPVYRPFMLETTRSSPRKGGTSMGRIGKLRESDLGQKLNQRLPPFLRDRLEKTSRQRVAYQGHGYHYQADEVARCLAAGTITSPLMPTQESVAILEILDQAYQTLNMEK